jgi:hypothetical protein
MWAAPALFCRRAFNYDEHETRRGLILVDG